jgi:hypothetical protein
MKGKKHKKDTRKTVDSFDNREDIIFKENGSLHKTKSHRYNFGNSEYKKKKKKDRKGESLKKGVASKKEERLKTQQDGLINSQPNVKLLLKLTFNTDHKHANFCKTVEKNF